MFATIEWQQNATLDNVLQDITDVICGETDPNNLSSDVVVANSDISTSISTSPWTLHDDVAGGHKQIRTLQADSGLYKHIGLHHKSDPLNNAMYAISCSEDWDNGAHTGTKVFAADYSYNQVGARQDIAAFQYYIYADAFMIYILPHADYDAVGNTEGSNLKNTGIGTFECSRDNPSMVVGDMPNWFVGNGAIFGGDTNNRFRVCSFFEGRDDVGSVVEPLQCYSGVSSRGNYNHSSVEYNTTLGAALCPATVSGADKYPVEHLIAMSCSGEDSEVNVGTYLGSISTQSNIWMLPEGSASILTLMSFKAGTYIILKAAHSLTTTGLDVGFKVMVPYG